MKIGLVSCLMKDEDPHRANSRCYVLYRNEIVISLPMGNIGLLELELY